MGLVVSAFSADKLLTAEARDVRKRESRVDGPLCHLGRLYLFQLRSSIRMQGLPEIDGLLQVQPELWLGSRELGESKSCVGCYRW